MVWNRHYSWQKVLPDKTASRRGVGFWLRQAVQWELPSSMSCYSLIYGGRTAIYTCLVEHVWIVGHCLVLIRLSDRSWDNQCWPRGLVRLSLVVNQFAIRVYDLKLSEALQYGKEQRCYAVVSGRIDGPTIFTSWCSTGSGDEYHANSVLIGEMRIHE